jgi:hypothetical protein
MYGILKAPKSRLNFKKRSLAIQHSWSHWTYEIASHYWGRFIEHKTKSQDFPQFGKSLVTFHNSAKVSKFGEFGGIFLATFDQKQLGKTWKCLFFLLYKQCKQCHNFCTTKFVYSTIRRKSKTLSYLDFVSCSMNRPQVPEYRPRSSTLDISSKEAFEKGSLGRLTTIRFSHSAIFYLFTYLLTGSLRSRAARW